VLYPFYIFDSINYFLFIYFLPLDVTENLPLVGKNFRLPKNLFARTGGKVHLRFDLVVSGDSIPNDLVLDLTLKKKIGWIWAKIPCIRKIGSW
jgi:hypothetical protein